ncbi:hypothetical protein ACIA5E_18805 [Nocardia asteroides]|uniref:hypothetical protein n=1 Tax=Nocardia asteroides TaxID=1824 RepID=UPI003787AFDC
MASWLKVATPAVMGAVVSTGLAVVVNLATGGGPWWSWVVVAVLTVMGCGTSLWLYQRQSTPDSAPSVTAAGEGAVAAHGTVGNVDTTGAAASPGAPSPSSGQAPPVAPGPGAVTASGAGSVAISGTAGDISTGQRGGQPSA